jgi:hypothetical protein
LVSSDHYTGLLKFNCIYGCMSVLFRTAVVREQGGFDERLTSAEDYDLYLRIARLHPIHCHHAPVALYRRHGGTLSRDPAIMLTATLSILKAQSRHTRGNRKLELARREGVRRSRHLYGGRLVERLRRKARARAWYDVVRGGFVLLRRDPARFLRNARRKLTKRLRTTP